MAEPATRAVAQTPRERVEAWVESTANVSEQQREAVEDPGDMFLSACPGSGKTRTVGVRLAWWSVHPELIDGVLRTRRIAALSYTNVAVQEIGLAAKAAGSAVGERDFLGTIHGFVLRYIVRPFGVAVMGCTAAPRLVAETRGRTKIAEEMVPFTERVGRRQIPRTISVWDLHFRADGSLVVGADAELYGCDMAHTAIAAAVQKAGRRVKHQLAADGLMSMSDALYWSMKILEVREHAEAVAARFDELIVDESQDTTDTQLRCLALLKAGGLRSLVCIGDPAQSIYGFAGAVPETLALLVDDLKLRRRYLKENWRSSRRICETAVHFSDRQQADDAVSERRDLPDQPELLIYDPDDLREPVARFEKRLVVLGLHDARAAILCRFKSTRDVINGTGGGVFKNRLAELADLAHAVQHGMPLLAHVVRDVELEIARHAWPLLVDDELDNARRYRLRNAVVALAESLPATSQQAKEWAKSARDLTNDTIAQLEEPASGARLTYNPATPPRTGSCIVAELLAGRQSAMRARTIHSVKGESYDATLTIAAVADRFDNVADWLSEHGEERRVAYVALTRAKSYSALAVPATCPADRIAELERRGFVVMP